MPTIISGLPPVEVARRVVPADRGLNSRGKASCPENTALAVGRGLTGIAKICFLVEKQAPGKFAVEPVRSAWNKAKSGVESRQLPIDV